MGVPGWVIGIGLGLTAAWLFRSQTTQAATLPPGVSITLPPIPLGGVSSQDAGSILTKLQPSITPHLFPLGWTVTWPSVEIPTDFGSVPIQIPSMELPFIPLSQAEQLVNTLRPQLVNTDNGLAIQVTANIPT